MKVTTPHFEICELEHAHRMSLQPQALFDFGKGSATSRGLSKAQAVAITGSNGSRRRTLSFKHDSSGSNMDEGNEDLVSWHFLLDTLHSFQQEQLNNKFDPVPMNPSQFQKMDQGIAIICVKPRIRSSDLMPPDVVRPMASTTLGVLISMAHRLGMVWTDLSLRSGQLHAEGHGQSFSATLMRGMGLVVEYNESQSFYSESVATNLFVPSIDSDKVRQLHEPSGE